MVIFHTYYGIGQYQITNISKSGVLEFKLSMGVLQVRNYIISHIALTSWDMWILQDLFFNGNHTSLTVSTDPIMLSLMNIIIIFPQNTSTHTYHYSFNKILKIILKIWILLTWFRVNLILHLILFFIQKLLHMKLRYLLLGRNLVSIYWMMNNLQSLIILIQLKFASWS